jgi:ankyrin repeat protein
MLKTRSELVNMDVSEDDEHRALHYAVQERSVPIVRLLMQYGADARKGIWPNREATSALTLARERGYDEIVSVIEEEESQRSKTAGPSEMQAGPLPDEQIEQLMKTGDEPRIIAFLEANPSLRQARYDTVIGDDGGLLSLAVKHNRSDILKLLLDMGFDPDERVRLQNLDEIVFSAGGPLYLCASAGKLEMAEMLLAHGANPNAEVYAAGSVLFRAYQRKDWPFVKLLERCGATLDAASAGYLCQTDAAKQMFAEDAAGGLREGMVAKGKTPRRRCGVLQEAVTLRSYAWRLNASTGRATTRVGTGPCGRR